MNESTIKTKTIQTYDPGPGNDLLDNQTFALICKAFSHPARIRIVEHLKAVDRCICGEIVEKLPLAQSTVSQHLKELKKYGLISSEIDGPKSCYTINWNKLESYFGLVQGFADNLKKMNTPLI